MKATLSSVSIFLLGFWLPVYAQAPTETPEKKNSLEFFFPVCDFLDGSPTNWGILVPGSAPSKIGQKVIPRTYGLQFVRILSPKVRMRASLLRYYMEYPDGVDIKARDVLRRDFGSLSFGYQYQLFKQSSFSLYGLAEATYRLGDESVHITYSIPIRWERLLETIILSDVGVSAGLRVEQNLPCNFFLSMESLFTQFVFLWPSERLASYTPPIKASPHLLTCKVALGYRF